MSLRGEGRVFLLKFLSFGGGGGRLAIQIVRLLDGRVLLIKIFVLGKWEGEGERLRSVSSRKFWM